MFDWIVVGAGLTGCVFAEHMAAAGKSVAVVEREASIGGAVRDGYDPRGYFVNFHGPHIFHTDSDQIINYVKRFCSFRETAHLTQIEVNHQRVPLPINFNSLDALFPERSHNLIRKLMDLQRSTVSIHDLRKSPDAELHDLGEFLYRTCYENYSRKQWAVDPAELDSSVLARIPIRCSREDKFFLKKHQGVPQDGFTVMLGEMLKSPNIEIFTGIEAGEFIKRTPHHRLFNTGRIDAYYDFRFGTLQFRSLRFDSFYAEADTVNKAAQINFPEHSDYTRSIEYKHFSGQKIKGSVLVYEYPLAADLGKNLPYYPVRTAANRELFAKYQALARADGIVFAGRVGNFSYYDMDEVVGQSAALFKQLVKA